jgi:hypothetical protein
MCIEVIISVSDEKKRLKKLVVTKFILSFAMS